MASFDPTLGEISREAEILMAGPNIESTLAIPIGCS